MATQPTNDLLVWANTDINLPNLAGPNKTEPSTDLVAKGWDFKQKPSADEFNYILNNLGEWVEYLKTLTAEGTPSNTPSTLVERNASGNFAASMITSNLTGNVTGNADTATNATQHINTKGGVHGAVAINSPGNLMMRDGNGDVAARYFVGDLTGNADTATKWQTPCTLSLTGSLTGSAPIDGSGNVSIPTSISASAGVAILTGTVSHGGTIPLPSGFTESQCKWLVSINQQITALSTDGADDHEYLVCSTSGRVVSCYISTKDSPTTVKTTGIANYIIIGVK